MTFLGLLEELFLQIVRKVSKSPAMTLRTAPLGSVELLIPSGGVTHATAGKGGDQVSDKYDDHTDTDQKNHPLMPRDNVASQKESSRANPSAFLLIPLSVSTLHREV